MIRQYDLQGWVVLPEKIVRDQEGADGTPICSKQDMIGPIPCSQLVRRKHLIEPERSSEMRINDDRQSFSVLVKHDTLSCEFCFLELRNYLKGSSVHCSYNEIASTDLRALQNLY